jgi:hypothetical protein
MVWCLINEAQGQICFTFTFNVTQSSKSLGGEATFAQPE